jgi:hypothetical protein
MSLQSLTSTLLACGLLACSLSPAWAQTTTTVVVTAPAPAPVLVPAPAPAPAPTKLGRGEGDISMALAKAELSKLGIKNPTRAQLDAALNGGTVTTAQGTRVQLTGVRSQRQSGMGWGQIANAMGLKLGAVVSAAKTAGKHEDTRHHDSKHEKHAHKEDARTQSTLHAKSDDGAHAGGSGGNGGGGGGGHGGSKK